MFEFDLNEFMQSAANNLGIGIQALHMLEFEEYGGYYPASRKWFVND